MSSRLGCLRINDMTGDIGRLILDLSFFAMESLSDHLTLE
ncbi:hypothetical protein M8C21_019809, partial [Ambrosia artemisiifolia]